MAFIYNYDHSATKEADELHTEITLAVFLEVLLGVTVHHGESCGEHVIVEFEYELSQFDKGRLDAIVEDS